MSARSKKSPTKDSAKSSALASVSSDSAMVFGITQARGCLKGVLSSALLKGNLITVSFSGDQLANVRIYYLVDQIEKTTISIRDRFQYLFCGFRHELMISKFHVYILHLVHDLKGGKYV